MDESKPVLCSRCHVQIEVWVDANGQKLAACPNCGQSDTLDNASGEAVSYLTDKVLREMLLAGLGNMSDMTITGSSERDYRFIFGD
jgi:hypothetical protein